MVAINKALALGVALVAIPLLARAQDASVAVAKSDAAVSGSAIPDGAASGTAAPAAAAAPIDPARLSAARRTVDYVFPAGTYARIMSKSMDAMMGPMMDGVGALPLGSLAGMGGASPEDVAKLGKTTLAELMTILDPAYRQRLQITTRVTTSEMASMMSEVEPGMRDALSRAYARRFDLSQLNELNRFFATPTGSSYAAESMTIMADPDVIRQMQAFVPVMLKRMPEMGAKIQAATAALPKPRKYEDLSPAEKAHVDSLMGKSTESPAQ